MNETELEHIIDLSWAAGFIDGEGCITLARGNNRTHFATYSPTILVSQIGRFPLDELERILGGSVSKARVTNNGRQVWQWRLGGAELVKEALEELLPYLRQKDAQAEIVSEFCTLIGNPKNNNGQRGGPCYSDFEIRLRMKLVNQLHEARKAA